MKKRIQTIAAVVGVLIVLVLIMGRYDRNIPYVPPYPGSTELESSSDPNVLFGGIIARFVVSLPENTRELFRYEVSPNTAYKAYITLLNQHSWQGLGVVFDCSYRKFFHEDTVHGAGWTLSLDEKYGNDNSHLIEAVVTRGKNTGPQYCRSHMP